MTRFNSVNPNNVKTNGTHVFVIFSKICTRISILVDTFRYHLKMAPDCLNFRRLVVVLTMSFKCLVATLNLEIYQVNLSQWLFVKFLGTNPAGLWWPTSQKATASDTEYWIAYVRRETVLFVGSECLFSVFVTPGGGQVKWKCLNLSDFSRFAATGFSGISPWSGSGCPRLVLGWGDGRH